MNENIEKDIDYTLEEDLNKFNTREGKVEYDLKVSDIILGIDFGTTNSQASYIDLNKREVLIEAFEGSGDGKAFPSVVAFQKNGEIIAGKKALDLSHFKNLDGIKIISRIKKLIKYNLKGLKEYYKANPNSDLEREFGIPKDLNGNEIEPITIASIIFKKIKEEAERQLGHKVEYAVVTVPAYYQEIERLNTKMAARLAGLKVLRLINEPTAAAIAYGYHSSNKAGEKTLVFDLGGGTFDASLIEIDNGVFRVISTVGVSQAGGTNITDAITAHVIKFWNFENKFKIEDKDQIKYITQIIEKTKINLTSQIETNILIPDLVVDGKSYNLSYLLRREELPQITKDILSKIEKTFIQLVKEYNLDKEPIDILMVGGPTRSKLIDDFIKKVLPNAKINKRVNPMTCVSLGAAIQGAILKGAEKDLVLLDVVNMSLGVETLGGIFEKIIEKDSTIPCIRSKEFTNPADNTETMTISILRGQRIKSSDNELLGHLRLTGLPKMRANQARITITLEIDADGQIQVRAEEKVSGKKADTTLKVKGQLSMEEVEKIMKDVEANKEQDEIFRKRTLLENDLKALKYDIFSYNEKLTDYKEKKYDVSNFEDLIKKLENNIKEGQKLLELENYDGLEILKIENLKIKQELISLIDNLDSKFNKENSSNEKEEIAEAE